MKEQYIVYKCILEAESYGGFIVFLFTDTYNYLKQVCSILLLQY